MSIPMTAATIGVIGMRVRSLLSRPIARHPLLVWLLWAAAASVLASCPMLLSDPAMWFYLLDPELLALIVIIGLRYARLELFVLSAQIRAYTGIAWR